MARLTWHTLGSKQYEAGVDRGVLYVGDNPGVPWTGLTSVDESPDGGGIKSYYLDGQKYLQVASAEEYAATISALTYPPEFEQCDGSLSPRAGLMFMQQRRKPFGFSYRTMIGNEQGSDHAYKVHVVYNAIAQPTSRNYASIGDSAEPTEFSWSITTKPPAIPGYTRTSHIVIDSRTTDSRVLADVEEVLYGSDQFMPRLPSPTELIEMYDAFYVFVVTDNGDRTYTISGPDEAIENLDGQFLQMTWPTVVQVNDNTYTISSD